MEAWDKESFLTPPPALTTTPPSLTLREVASSPHPQLNPACLQPQGKGPPWAHRELPPAQVIHFSFFPS